MWSVNEVFFSIVNPSVPSATLAVSESALSRTMAMNPTELCCEGLHDMHDGSEEKLSLGRFDLYRASTATCQGPLGFIVMTWGAFLGSTWACGCSLQQAIPSGHEQIMMLREGESAMNHGAAMTQRARKQTSCEMVRGRAMSRCMRPADAVPATLEAAASSLHSQPASDKRVHQWPCAIAFHHVA
jgi:hypothetical protein